MRTPRASAKNATSSSPTTSLPDLVIEIDVTASAVQRLPIFAALGIAEEWQFSDRGLEFLHLQVNATYRAGDRSLAFPTLAVSEAERHLNEGRDAEKAAWGRSFRAYVRDQLVPRPPRHPVNTA